MSQQHAIYIPTPILQQLSCHQYAQSCQLYSIFAEITRVILRKNGVLTSQATQQYLQQCSKGQHVLLKSYGSFHKSALNRLCFLSNFTKIFQLDTHSRNGLDYFQLLRLLCSDFPKQIMTSAVNLLHPNISNNMSLLLDSKKIVNALYVYFIYWDFCEALLTKLFENEPEKICKNMYELYEWIKNYDMKFNRIYQKPPIGILIQVILNIMEDKKMLGKHAKIVFLTQYNIEGYLSEKVKVQQQLIDSQKINFWTFLTALLDDPEHIKLVQQNMAMFDIPQIWANQSSKLLTLKDPNQHHPINSKRIKKK